MAELEAEKEAQKEAREEAREEAASMLMAMVEAEKEDEEKRTGRARWGVGYPQIGCQGQNVDHPPRTHPHASAVPALVPAPGHRIDDVPEIPLVVDDAIESAKKTSAAKDILASVGALADVEKAADSKKIRARKGKARNRRYVLRHGPLVVFKTNDGVEQAFRNLPGVKLCCVDRLNLLQPPARARRMGRSGRCAALACHTLDGRCARPF